MGYLSLYRKWRPGTFDDLAGQSVVVKTLKNALTSGRIAHAYLFCGPRGTGKTSTAKLFAKALNCEHGPTVEPCNKCFACEQITSGRSVDVIEIDAASNRRIDEIRDLREKVKFSPSEGDYKVYIIDEVHMLTKEAFNALLKTLEEPPQNVVFILATTEPHKLLPTILSRCQRFDFGLLAIRELKERMRYICQQEGINADDSALELIARTAEGGMRDAISILDQAIAFGGEQVTSDDVNTILGKVDREMLAGAVRVIVEHNTEGALRLVNEIIDQGKDMNQFVKDLLYHFRDLMLIKECGVQNTVQDLPEEVKTNLVEQAGQLGIKTILRILETLSETDQQLKFAAQPRLVLEMMMIKLASKEADQTLTSVIGRLARLEEIIENGNFTANMNTNKPQFSGNTNVNATETNQLAEEKDSFATKIKQMKENATTINSGTGIAAPEVSNQAGAAKGETLPWEDGVGGTGTVTPATGTPPWESDMYLTDSAVSTAEIEVPPDREAGVSSVAAAGTGQAIMSMEEFMSHWNVAMTMMNKSTETRKLRAFLLNGKPQVILGDTLYIVYPPTSTFHKTNAEKEMDLLEKALKKVTGLNIKARCVFEGEVPRAAEVLTVVEGSVMQASGSPVQTSVGANVQIAGNTPQSVGTSVGRMASEEDPLVQKALKIFGGKIIQIDNE